MKEGKKEKRKKGKKERGKEGKKERRLFGLLSGSQMDRFAINAYMRYWICNSLMYDSMWYVCRYIHCSPKFAHVSSRTCFEGDVRRQRFIASITCNKSHTCGLASDQTRAREYKKVFILLSQVGKYSSSFYCGDIPSTLCLRAMKWNVQARHAAQDEIHFWSAIGGQRQRNSPECKQATAKFRI